MDAPFGNLSYNYVATCTHRDGTPAVLKLGFPGDEEAMREPNALAAFGGRGTVRLLDSEPEEGAMLLQRILPGDSLLSVEDDIAATRVLVKTIARLRTPVPAGHDFPNVRDWARGFARLRERHDGGTGPMPKELIEEAEELFARLLASTTEERLLHGDLHHDNVLAAGDGWLAIDPKGVVGDAAYECGAMFYNPKGIAHRLNLREVFEARLDILGEVTHYDRERILGWATAQAVLSVCWTLEGHGLVDNEGLIVARTLAEVS